MPIPDYQTLMLPVLRLAAQGETRVPDVEERVADEFGLTPGERNQLLPSGRQRVLQNRVHWAKFYMGKAGLVTSPRRGRFVATEAGRSLLASNPERIDVQRLLEFPSFREFYRGGQLNSTDLESPASGTTIAPASSPPPATPEEQIELAYAGMQSALRTH
jgi:restriction system protein